MNAWIGKRIGHLVLAGAFLTIVLAGFTIWVASQEATVQQEIPVIQRIGSPCRTAFAAGGLKAVRTNATCSLQARLIFYNLCSQYPAIPGCAAVVRGVVAHNGSSPSHLPGPPRGGLTPQRPTHTPETPSAPSSAPSIPSPLSPLTDPVCALTSALSAPTCLNP